MELALLAGKYVFVGLIYLFVFMVYRGLVRQSSPSETPPPRSAGPQVLRREALARPAPRVAPAAPPVAVAPSPSSAMPVAMREALHESPAPEAARPVEVPPEPALAASANARLTVVQSQTPEIPVGQEFPLLAAATIGRTEINSVTLPDHFISIQHAIIFLQDGRRILRDRGSTNGTLLNGRRVTSDMVLRDGDQIAVGTTVLEYSQPALDTP
jgi:hypothetical protein